MNPASLLGWRVFVLGHDKTPLPNCEMCRQAGPEHNREACDHLTCHGIYAATNDPRRWQQMMERYPGHPWALRTGAASGVVVLDAEGHRSPSGFTGVDILDDFESWTGHPLQWTELAAETPSRGVHLFYRDPGGVRSRNRVLPQVDIKSDGGYVVIPTLWSDNRRWLRSGEPAEPEPRLVDWLRTARGRSSGGAGGPVGHLEGYDFDRFLRERCPGGMRDEFFNDLIFRLRKAGVDRATLTMRVRAEWKKAEQPPAATWYMPWWNCEYKIEKVWRTVAPDPEPNEDQMRWATDVQQSSGPVRVGRVTLAPRESR